MQAVPVGDCDAYNPQFELFAEFGTGAEKFDDPTATLVIQVRRGPSRPGRSRHSCLAGGCLGLPNPHPCTPAAADRACQRRVADPP
jgi:hypothetical protein